MTNSALPSEDAAAAATASRSAQACAACKYQRRRCIPGCILAPYFPANNPDLFEAAHNLFGVRNILKTISKLDDTELSQAMSNVIFQSSKRREDPVGGCFRIMYELRAELDAAAALRDQLRQKRESLLSQIESNGQNLQGDEAAALPSPISADPPPPSPQQQQERQQKYHDNSGGVKRPEEEIIPPPSWPALPPAGSDLGRNLPRRQSGEGDQDKLMAHMSQPMDHNLEEDQNVGLPFIVDPPPSSTALPPSGSDLPERENREGDEDKLRGATLQPTQDHQPTPLTHAVSPEEHLDDLLTFDFGDDILPYLTTPECPSLEEILKRPK